MESQLNPETVAATAEKPNQHSALVVESAFDEEAGMTAWLGMTMAVQQINQRWVALPDSEDRIDTP